MIPIKINDLKPDMIILEEDSYGNTVFKVLSKPYIPDSDPSFIEVKVKDVQTEEEMIIGEVQDSYQLTIFLIISSKR